MFNKEALGILLEKVPDLASPWGILLTMLYTVFLGFLCYLFFATVDRLSPYAPLASQMVMAAITVLISYLHFRLVDRYRQRYGSLAYRYYFYHLMLP